MRKLRWIATADVGPPVAAVTSTTARAPERTIVSAGAIANRDTVTLKDFSTASANSPAARFGGRVDRIFSTALNGFSGTLSEPVTQSNCSA